MRENSSAEKKIGKPDGPTSYFVIGGEQHILIEKRYGYIGGGASGNAKTVKQLAR